MGDAGRFAVSQRFNWVREHAKLLDLYKVPRWDSRSRQIQNNGQTSSKCGNHKELKSFALSPVASVTVAPLRMDMIPEVVTLHLKAFQGYMNTRMGTAYLTAFMKWFLGAERAIALVAMDHDGTILGYVVGAPQGYGRSINRELLWVTIGCIMMRPWLWFNRQLSYTIAQRLKFVMGLSASQEGESQALKPVMSLVGIGVAPSAQGRKVGRRLMQAFERRARELEIQSLQLSVRPDNIAARRLYENCGWQELPEFAHNRGTMRYFRVLSD